MSAFDKIYESNYWGFGSGHGSLPSVTKGYRAFVENFLVTNKIRSVLDFGCGDWQFSRLIKWGDIQYTGVDIASSVIDRNNRRFRSNKISFQKIEPRIFELPEADLLISKDVLQHMPRVDIDLFLKDVLPKYKFALITNCSTPVDILNIDISAGEFRPLDLRKAPYNFDAECVFTFSVPDVFSWRQFRKFHGSTKTVLLVRN